MANLKQEKIQVQVNDKYIDLEGDFVGNLFCVKEKSIDEHPLLTPKEKKSLKADLRENRNILLSK